ncbi:MAG: phosphoribosylaminoimidazolesuccinocarboxamide synthase [Acidobacteria bacterium]|nr:phosphoribosylaminoimidazolesuccinocarboxamide synthase [Acidobacteriota bacterium]
MDTVLLNTDLPGFVRIGQGKVRDMYAAGEKLLIVTTDRISAFDYILATGIPDKGRVLNQMTLFWLEKFEPIIPNHLISANVDEYPEHLRRLRTQLEGRSMLVTRAKMINIECVARGYLSGSGWKEYQRQGSVCGISLPPGLKESDRLPEPIFTPATKAVSGHDENITFETMTGLVGEATAGALRRLTLALYQNAADYALSRGIIIADTKFEFGFVGDRLVLADEVLTPDSSRFWPADSYAPGGPQPSYDKQYVRDYLESIRWNKQPPAPALPDDVVARTSEKYRQAFEALTGRTL